MSQDRKITIAMIDDHDQLRNGICEFLEQLGLAVAFQAENGQVGLQKMAEINPLPDVCVLDVNMPVMNGFETAEILHGKFPQVKILAFSMNNKEDSILGMIRS